MTSRKKQDEISVITTAAATAAATAATTAAATTTMAIVPRKGCFGYCRETEEERYETVLKSTNIDEHFKNSIRRRYIHLIQEFRQRAFTFSLLYHIGHLIITVGSLIVPALLSVQYSDSIVNYQTNIYWLTWAISLLVTTFNGILVLFKVDKKYHFIHTTLERLRSEGWQYIELTGRYAGHLLQNGTEATHRNQYRFFCHYVEKIKLAQIEEEYYKYEDANNPLTHNPTQKQNIKDSPLALPSINEEITLLKPPQSVKEVMAGLITVPDSPPMPKNETILVPVNNPKNK
jgi:hypothetical protein